MGARSKARKRALDILFESEQQGLPVGATLERHQQTAEPALNPYIVRLVSGVTAHLSHIDQAITDHAEGWALNRMPAVDRAVLRLGVYELWYADDVPDAVALDEAIELAKNLSTDQSPAFVNGVLAAIAGTTPPPEAPSEIAPEAQSEIAPEAQTGAVTR